MGGLSAGRFGRFEVCKRHGHFCLSAEIARGGGKADKVGRLQKIGGAEFPLDFGLLGWRVVRSLRVEHKVEPALRVLHDFLKGHRSSTARLGLKLEQLREGPVPAAGRCRTV